MEYTKRDKNVSLQYHLDRGVVATSLFGRLLVSWPRARKEDLRDTGRQTLGAQFHLCLTPCSIETHLSIIIDFLYHSLWG